MDEKINVTVDAPVVACDMTDAPDTPEERMAEYGRLFGQHLVSRERTAEGIRFRLRADDGVEAWVRDLLAREKACCPFFDFELATVDGVLRWDITVDDDLARAVLDEFYRATSTAGEDWNGVERRLTDLGFTITTNDTDTVTEVRPGA
jgi:hypothetical protein